MAENVVYDQKEHAECYQELFELMSDEHNLILLASEMDEIISASDEVRRNLEMFNWKSQIPLKQQVDESK